MRRTLSQVVASLVVIALIAPAASAVAGQDVRRQAPSGKASVSAPAPVSLKTAIDRAVTATQGTGPGPSTGQSKARGLRFQGGGKSGMVMGLTSAVIGVVGMVYMMKYLKDQQKATETTSVRVR